MKNPVRNITLNINPEIVCQIITASQEFHAKEGVTFPQEIDDLNKQDEYEYDPLQILADHKDDLTFLQVKSGIEDLEPDQQIELLALLYVGRGDFDISEWHQACKEAKDNIQAGLAEYLFSKPQLPEYLGKALELLGLSCEQ